MVKLQQDNHDKLGVKIPKQEIEQVIKKHMSYRSGQVNLPEILLFVFS